MKKLFTLIVLVSVMLLSCGFTFFDNKDKFELDDLYDYQKEFKTEELSVCSLNDAKTYMDYRMTKLVSSRQYQFLNYECTVDKDTGFLLDEEGFIISAHLETFKYTIEYFEPVSLLLSTIFFPYANENPNL